MSEGEQRVGCVAVVPWRQHTSACPTASHGITATQTAESSRTGAHRRHRVRVRASFYLISNKMSPATANLEPRTQLSDVPCAVVLSVVAATVLLGGARAQDGGSISLRDAGNMMEAVSGAHSASRGASGDDVPHYHHMGKSAPAPAPAPAPAGALEGSEDVDGQLHLARRESFRGRTLMMMAAPMMVGGLGDGLVALLVLYIILFISVILVICMCTHVHSIPLRWG